MGIWNRLFGGTSRRAVTYTQAASAGLLEPAGRSGVAVTEETALGVSAVWCAVQVISQSIGSLPLVLYRRKGEVHQPADEHDLFDILDTTPNPECTARTFWESYVANALLWGNAYAEVVRRGDGTVESLWLIHPRNVSLERDNAGRLSYRVRVGTIDAALSPEDVLHVPGLSPDTVAGWNLLKVARDNISFSIAADRYGQSYFQHAGNVGTYLMHPGQLSDQARENLRRSFQRDYAGVENTGKAFVLEEGLQVQRQTLSNDAAQYTETREYQVAEVSRLFNISPVKLHSLGRATWGNLSALNTDFWGNTCRPWASKIEAEVSRKLLLPRERRRYFAEFDADVLVRGDITTRYAAYKTGIEAGFLTPELVAAWENLPKPPEPEPVPVAQPAEVPVDNDDNASEVPNAVSA